MFPLVGVCVGAVSYLTYEYFYPSCGRCLKRISEPTLEIHNKLNHYFPCPECSESFETKDLLRTHYDKLHCYRCDYCRQSILKRERETHLQSKHYFPCTYPSCEFREFTQFSLRSHYERVHCYCCEFCQQYKLKEDRDVHLQESHYFPCTYPNCKFRYFTKLSLQSHYESVHCYRCAHCKRVILNDNRETHILKKHHFPCSFPPCKFVFYTESAEKSHYEKEHCYRCQYCYMLILKVEESRHNGKYHRIPCSHCESVFPTEKIRDEHHEQEHRCLYCSELCPRYSYYYPDIGEHIKKCHTFRCEHCGKILRTQSRYDSHLSEYHRFPCPYCNDVVISKKLLETHLRTKAHPNAFCCKYCTKKYSFQEHYQQHLSSAHQFPCLYCEHAFATDTKFLQHVRRCHYTPKELSELPFEDAKGRWTDTETISEKADFKSFGVFECVQSDKKWFSAHAHSKYRQKCHHCREWCPPKYMWINDSSHFSRDRVNANDKPHPREDCEACLEGMCLSGYFL